MSYYNVRIYLRVKTVKFRNGKTIQGLDGFLPLLDLKKLRLRTPFHVNVLSKLDRRLLELEDCENILDHSPLGKSIMQF